MEQQGSPRVCTFHSLSDDLLQQIFSHVLGQRQRVSLSSVCLRWRSVLRTYSHMWESLIMRVPRHPYTCFDHLGEQRMDIIPWMTSALLWLARQRLAIESLELHGNNSCACVALLGQLPGLQKLQLVCRLSSPGAMACMQAVLSALPITNPMMSTIVITQDLEDKHFVTAGLHLCTTPLQYAGRLSDLSLLHKGVSVAEGAAALASHITGLQHLKVQGNIAKLPALGQLTGLESLWWGQAGISVSTSELSAALRTLSNLTQVKLDGLAGVTALELSASRQPRLQELFLKNMVDVQRLPTDMWNMMGIRTLCLIGECMASAQPDEWLRCMAHPSCLQPLTSLHTLKLTLFSANCPNVITSLVSLTNLRLWWGNGASQNLSCSIPNLSSLHNLRRLHLLPCQPCSLHTSQLLTMQHLSVLRITRCPRLDLGGSWPCLARQLSELKVIELQGSTLI